MNDSEYMTAPTAARFWGTTSVTLKSWFEKGLIPVSKTRKKGNRTVFEREFIVKAREDFLEGKGELPPKI